MKISIPVQQKTPAGGAQFIGMFLRYLEQLDWVVTRDIRDDYDVLFINSWQISRREVLGGVRRNPDARVVHRIDGVAQAYGRDDDADERQGLANRYADLTIFQSNYCKEASRGEFSVISHDGPVIFNPVDVTTFTPEGPIKELDGAVRVACVTWSTNPFKGADSIYTVARARPDIDFYLCGRYPDAPVMPNLHLMGVLDRKELAVVLRSCDVFLTFSRNEACPNHVLEALASGLPVLYDDSGASLEVTGDAGLPVTTDTFSSRLERILEKRNLFSEAARSRAMSEFHPDIIFKRYTEAILETLDRPTLLPVGGRKAEATADAMFAPLRMGADLYFRIIRRLGL